MDTESCLFLEKSLDRVRLANVMKERAKSMPSDLPLKSTSLLLDRFRALLKWREKERRVSGDQYVPLPTTDEIVQLYELFLSELNIHSKPFIADLTIIAGEQREHAKSIADAICCRILEAPAEQKLPSLYLLDSIVKIIGQEYVQYFSLHLSEVFCEAYQQIQPNLHDSMYHLFRTWSVVFPPSVLSKIEAELQFSQIENNRSSPNEFKTSEPSGHGIHVNQKHMQLLEHINVDSIGTERLKSLGTVGHANSIQRPHKISPLSTVRLGRPASPSRLGLDRSSLLSFDASDNSSRIVGEESPCQHAFEYGNPLAEWRRKQFNDESCNKLEISTTYSLDTENVPRSPRSLVHAYGSDRRTKTLGNRSSAVEQLTINAIDKKVTQTSWKNSGEEFDWEDMSPTFADRARNIDFLPSPHPHHPVSVLQPPFSAVNASTLVLESRNSWSSRAQLQSGDDSSTVAKVGGRGLHLPPLVEKSLRANSNPYAVSAFVPSISSCCHDSVNLNVNMQNTRPLNINPGLPLQNHGKSQCFSIISFPQLSNQCNGLLVANQHNSEHVTSSQQLFLPKDEHVLNSSQVVQLPITCKYTANNPFPLQWGAFSSPPLGAFSVASQAEPQENNPMISHQSQNVSSFINSIMTAGVLSVANQTPIQDCVGIEFNPDVVKVRHESAIHSLYSDLPRQCTTCGLRLKSQEEHCSHMDWHVTKNRMSKSHKQKPFRKWFVSQGLWLSSAEAFGTDAVPGFLPPEVVEKKKDEEEIVVLADEEQNVCALCGEPFDEFYSDEMEEWMYKGAIYLHAQKGYTVGVDRSLLGPIVHAKCRSDSSGLPSEDFGLIERGLVEGGIQRKRLRRN